MDFAKAEKVKQLRERLLDFMEPRFYTAETVYADQVTASGDSLYHPPIMEVPKAETHAARLWNLFRRRAWDRAAVSEEEDAG